MKFLYNFLMVMLSISLLTACSNSYDSPESTARTFYCEIFSGNVNKAIDMVDLSDMAKHVGEVSGKPFNQKLAEGQLNRMYHQMQRQITQIGEIKSIQTRDVIYYDNNTRAIVRVGITFKINTNVAKNESTSIQELQLKRFGDRWKIMAQ